MTDGAGHKPALYELVISAHGEVRDANGDLISSEPMQTTVTVTEQQLSDLGLNQGEQA